MELAIKLNEKAKMFSVSSSIFAAKKIISVIYRNENHKICNLFSCARDHDIVHIERFNPSVGCLGYRIVIPQYPGATKTKENSCNITKGIGALLLSYSEIKDNENIITNVEEKVFKDKWKDIKRFSECLSEEKAKHLKDLAKNDIKSKERILGIISKNP